MGHLGVEQVLHLAKQRFYWPGMQKDIEFFITKVCKCNIQKKPAVHTRAPTCHTPATALFEIISTDHLHLEKSRGGYEYNLVIIDNFTKFAQAYPTHKKSGKTAADTIFNDYAPKYGFPTKIHHDQGREFKNCLFRQLQKYKNTQALQTLKQLLTTLKGTQLKDLIVHCYLCCGPWMRRRREIGVTMWAKLYTHTTVRLEKQQVTLLSIRFLVESHVCQLMIMRNMLKNGSNK